MGLFSFEQVRTLWLTIEVIGIRKILGFTVSQSSDQLGKARGASCVRRIHEEFLMARKKPPPRVAVQRSRNNAKRRLIVTPPSMESRVDLSERVTYGCYSKHKYNPTAYNLSPYGGQDEERTYCDEHAHLDQDDFKRIPALLVRGVMLGLWSDQNNGGAPGLLWTLDESGWIFELRITNSGRKRSPP